MRWYAKKQLLIRLVAAVCVLFLCKYLWDEVLITQRYWRKRFGEFEKLDQWIVDDIKSNLKVNDVVPKINYSVLTDTYYTYQFRHLSANPASCHPLKVLDLDYKLCPEADDYMSAYHVHLGMGHFRTFGYLLWILQHTPGVAYIDIGSNIGLIALPLIVALGHRTKVVALDANPSNVRSLARGAMSNGFPMDNWAIVNRALSSTVDTKVELVLYSNSTNGAVKADIKDTRQDFTGPKITVLSATIDSHVLPVALALNITTAVMKIDIEGSECLALQHAQSLFRSIYIPYIIMEYSLQMGYPREDCMLKLFATMKNLSYYPFQIGSNGLEGMLDIRYYKYWLESDIVWKKVV